MIKVAFVNKKGGVGKTVVSDNSALLTATEYLKEGERMLYIDCDPQGNSTSFFYNLEINEKPKYNIKDLFLNPKLDIKKAIVQARVKIDDNNYKIIPNLDVITSEYSFDKEVENIKSLNKKNILINHLKKIENDYKFCFFDCPPKISSIIENLLVASDIIVILIESDGDAIDGMISLLEDAYRVKNVDKLSDINYWILWNTFDSTSKIMNKWSLDEMNNYRHRLLKTKLRKRDIYTQSKSFKKPISVFKNSSGKKDAIEDLNNFLKEMFERNNII